MLQGSLGNPQAMGSSQHSLGAQQMGNMQYHQQNMHMGNSQMQRQPMFNPDVA